MSGRHAAAPGSCLVWAPLTLALDADASRVSVRAHRGHCAVASGVRTMALGFGNPREPGHTGARAGQRLPLPLPGEFSYFLFRNMAAG